MLSSFMFFLSHQMTTSGCGTFDLFAETGRSSVPVQVCVNLVLPASTPEFHPSPPSRLPHQPAHHDGTPFIKALTDES